MNKEKKQMIKERISKYESIRDRQKKEGWTKSAQMTQNVIDALKTHL